MKKLRIAQIGTIWETTPPKLYGGTERILHSLTEELVRQGHEVTLFATGDSKTSAKLSATFPKAAYRYGVPWENFLYPLEHILSAFDRASEFDIIHMHLNQDQDYVALALQQYIKTPMVVTIHLAFPEAKDTTRHDELIFLKKYRNVHFVSISNAQRTLDLNYNATVYNGLDFSEYNPPEKPGNDLVWIGRFIPEKSPHEAISAARQAKMKIILAGKVDYLSMISSNYFKNKVESHIDNQHVTYIGEVNDVQKRRLLKKAKAFLMPIRWNEPFGLTMIEAMAMGVPVIAFDTGPVREIILDGKTRFIVKNAREMAQAIKKVDSLDRKFISQYAKSSFNAEAMTQGYLKVYESLLRQEKVYLNGRMLPSVVQKY